MAKTVVILGAGWTGLPLAHKLLKYTRPKVDLKVVLVSPNDHFFWNVAATRALIPGSIPDSQIFLPIEPGFKPYADAFEFVLGRAEKVDPASDTVTISTKNGVERSIPFDHLVIATGSRLSSNLPLKPIGSHEDTLAAWKTLQGKVGKAKDIVVSGAGATGVEVAGELAAKYGSEKRITLILSGDEPLSKDDGVLPSVRSTIASDLRKLGVNLIRRVKVTEVREGPETTTLVLSDSRTLTTDCYLPLHGIRVNTSFAPTGFLDAHGNIKLDDHMRAVGAKNIWALGDVGDKEPKQITITDNQIIYLAGALDAVLTGNRDVAPYVPDSKTLVFVSLGPKLATGQVGGWKLFGFMVSWVKGKKLFVDKAGDYVAGRQLRHSAV